MCQQICLWSRTKFSIYFYQCRGTASNVFFPYLWLRQLHLDQGCMSQIFIWGNSALYTALFSLLDWQLLLVHKRIQLILYFSLSCQQINLDCLCDPLLSAIVCSVYGSLAKKASNLSKTVNKVLSVPWWHHIRPKTIMASLTRWDRKSKNVAHPLKTNKNCVIPN